MIETRTSGALLLFGLAVAVAAAKGVLSPAHLAGLGPAACLLAGFLASAGAALVARRWRFYQRAILVLAFLLVGLVSFDDPAAAKLVRLPETVSLSLTEYCPESPELSEAKEPEPAPAAAPRGCALIRRAYELGYADSLGACAPKEQAAAPEAQESARPTCRLRRADEPLFHYAWRTLDDRAGAVADLSLTGSIGRSAEELEVRLGYLDTLFARQAHAIAASAHASHHLFTNLPDPRPRSWLARLLSAERCAGGAVAPGARLDWEEASAPASALVDHALSRLLFEPSLGPPAGACPDYTIHWDAPADACVRLAEDPVGFLGEAGALAPVRAVLDRRRRQDELRALAAELKEGPPPPPPAPSRVVSFHCYVVDPEGTGAPRERALTLDGDELVARSLRTPKVGPAGPAQLEVYEDLTLLFAGVRYSGPSAEPGQSVSTAPAPTPKEVYGPGFSLTRLERLREADPFLGAGWPLSRADLVEIYPFHHHLFHLAQVFRRSYRLQRGRL